MRRNTVQIPVTNRETLARARNTVEISKMIEIRKYQSNM